MSDQPTSEKTYEVGVYRTVVHHRTVFVEAVSGDAAYERASEIIDSTADGGIGVGWRHQRTELGVRFVKRTSEWMGEHS